MLSAGLDFHKRYSQIEVLNEAGLRRASARLPNEFKRVEEFFGSLGEPCRVVLEAGWNWGLMYEWLERVDNVSEVQLAHPYRTRAIPGAHVIRGAISIRVSGSSQTAYRSTEPAQRAAARASAAPPLASVVGSRFSA